MWKSYGSLFSKNRSYNKKTPSFINMDIKIGQ